MADTKITALTELASAYATGDLLCLVDVSDTTMDAAGTNKRTTLANLLKALPGNTDAVSLGISGASLTGSNASSLVDLAATWNTTGTPTAIKLNVTDTASNAESLLMDLQTGGTSRCAVLKSGSIRLRQYEGIGNDGSQGSKWTFNNGSAVLGKWDSTDYLKVAFNANTTTLHADHALCWGSSAVSSEDVFLYRDAAAVLALRNSTNAQAFRVYNTYTDASNNEYGAFAWAANVLQVGSVATGSGSNRDTELIASSGTVRLGSGVMFQPMTNYKIGNSGGIMAFQFVGSTSGAWNGGQFYGFNGFVAAKTSSETLTLYNERGLSTVITNEGATSKPTLSLTGASAGLFYEFAVQDADGLRIEAATGDTIRVTDSVTASGGYIESTTIGSVVRLFALNTTEWVATSIHGVWTDGTWTYDDSGLTT